MTEESRNVRGSGSFPPATAEGSEPTEQVAAPGDPSPAYPNIPTRPPTPAVGRSANPWSTPPPGAPAHPVDTYSMSAGSAERPAVNNRPASPAGPYFAPRSPAETRAGAGAEAEAETDLDAWDPQTIRQRIEPPPADPADGAAYDPWDPYAPPPPSIEDRPGNGALYPALSESGLYTPAVNKAAAGAPIRDHGLPAAPTPRILPTPPPPRPTRLLTGLLVGFLAGLVLFTATGVLLGRATAPTPRQPNPPPPTPTLFEQTQANLNRPKFAGTALLPLAQAWLPHLSTCARATANADDGEQVRIRCTASGMSAFFVQYKTVADRDKARADLKKQANDARTLTPGAAGETAKSSGNYVEYAYRLTEGGVTRTVAGIWWEQGQAPTAAYLLAYWKDGLGERWEPMRDLWSRYA